MKRKVNPNRMMLLRMRRRLELASRGHKLLKNKQEKLMQNFISLARETAEMRRRIEEVFLEISMHYLRGRSVTGRQRLEDALALTTMKGTLETDMRIEMNVRYPKFTFTIPEDDPAYSLAGTSPELDVAFGMLRENFQDLLDLAASEDGLFKLAEELEKTRRRVNALEYILIPDLEEQIRSIESKLSEAERSTQTRLMKIKDMVEARESRR
ncbi:MAG TPA: V-type ATP synthase subunit D [Candidatus Eisenbacteria bacterium]|uniref:V-type ATP synthase subunit D n=1 Tax=Eiseniibacteriota bacterium TaxID=2212470 RepID=A0A7V2F2G4_UNCEI|nr:V-type ATP synthase subunit D [Candidatus Eisenbacteria bacterium]